MLPVSASAPACPFGRTGHIKTAAPRDRRHIFPSSADAGAPHPPRIGEPAVRHTARSGDDLIATAPRDSGICFLRTRHCRPALLGDKLSAVPGIDLLQRCELRGLICIHLVLADTDRHQPVDNGGIRQVAGFGAGNPATPVKTDGAVLDNTE